MAKLTVIPQEQLTREPRYQAPRASTGAASSTFVAPDGYALWVCDAQLEDGATIHWSGPHSDDAVYVLSGELDVEGRTCPAGGAVIVEADAVAVARARGVTRVVHFGSLPERRAAGGLLGDPAPDGRGVHVLGPGGMFQSGQREGVHAVWYADGTCATCRCQLLEVVAPPTDDRRGKPHSHSEDEIIYLLEGSISMGSYSLRPGTALCVPGDVRYSLVGGPDGHRFLNFRRDVSTQVYERGSEPLLETGLARGGRETADVR